VPQERLYLYGIMTGEVAPLIEGGGLDGQDVFGCRCGQFVALVSLVRPDAVSFEAEAVLAHEHVLTQAMRWGTIIPAAFGHLFESEAELCRHLESAATQLQENLDALAGRVEIGIKANWKKDALLPDIETSELQQLIRDAQHPEADPSLTIAVGQLVEQLVAARREEYIQAICDKLRDAAVAMRINEAISPRVVFNAAFLIDQHAEHEFFRLAEKVVHPYSDRLEFSYSGPWPPHNFSWLRIGD
jgi:hypothetical protein